MIINPLICQLFSSLFHRSHERHFTNITDTLPNTPMGYKVMGKEFFWKIVFLGQDLPWKYKYKIGSTSNWTITFSCMNLIQMTFLQSKLFDYITCVNLQPLLEFQICFQRNLLWQKMLNNSQSYPQSILNCSLIFT